MRTRLSVFLAVFLMFPAGAALAQQCLHGANETPEQAARRREALTATRTINNIQANQPGAAQRQYFTYEQLASAPFAATLHDSTNETIKRISLKPDTDILPNWKLTLDVTRNGYWFMIADTTDPCHFAYISNQVGIIFQAEPIR